MRNIRRERAIICIYYWNKDGTYNTPPESVSKVAELLRIGFLLSQVHQERGEDERQESDIYSGE